jgi:hypothetical protein
MTGAGRNRDSGETSAGIGCDHVGKGLPELQVPNLACMSMRLWLQKNFVAMTG